MRRRSGGSRFTGNSRRRAAPKADFLVSTIGELANNIAGWVANVFALANALQRLCDQGMLMLAKKFPSYSVSRTDRHEILKKLFVIKGVIIISARPS
jgi:hypothetical protein